MVKLLLKVLPYSIFIKTYYNFFSIRKRKYLRHDSFKKFKNLESLNLKKYKSSSKIFIIGSGASINKITKRQWQEINENDSFGFNFSFINRDHTPTFYASEAMAGIDLNTSGRSPVAEKFYTEFKKERERFKNVPKILSDLEPDRLQHFLNYGRDVLDENLYLVNTVNGLARTSSEFKQLIKFYKSKGIFDKKTHIDEVFKFRATLSMAISLSINLGYEEIILCGIDLNDPRYFYQDKNMYPDTPAFRSSPNTPKHSTLFKRELYVSIDEVVKYMNLEICKPKNIKLFVQNPDSALSNFLNTYKI